MCRCRESSSHRIHSTSAKSFRRDEAVPRRISRVDRNVSTSFGFASALIVALACTVGSELERTHQPQARATYNAAGPFLRSAQRFFGGLRHRTSADRESLLTKDQLESYARDGFIVLSGLLDDGELNNLVDAGESRVAEHMEKSGGGKMSDGNFQVHEFGLVLNDKRFRDVALRSKLPLAAAELMRLDGKTQNLRVLRDVFLAKGHESTSSCGWHIDDQVFWPAAYQLPHPSQVDQSGVNAWIALDDMPTEHGGSMAVSPSSHAQDFSWKSDALAALNFDDRFGNGISKDDLFEMIKSGKVDSCALEKVAPHVYNDIELSKQEFNFKRGDVIFMNRWLFHKSTDVTEKGKVALQALEESSNGSALLKRYSIRFATGDTSLPEGFMTEMSVLASDGSNLGRGLDDVSGEWYPKCWPEVDVDVDEKMDDLVRHEVPVAQERLGAVMAEAMKLFRSR